jgi:hypothetical protein
MSSYPARLDSILALEKAIEAYHGYTGPGPGKWTVDSPGRLFIAPTWTGQFKTNNHVFDGQRPWKEFGGNVILKTSGQICCRVLSAEAADGSHFFIGHYLGSRVIRVRSQVSNMNVTPVSWLLVLFQRVAILY